MSEKFNTHFWYNFHKVRQNDEMICILGESGCVLH